MSFIHTEEWTWIVIDPTLLIYCMLVCVFYDSHFNTWIRLYFYVIYLFQCNEWLFCDGIICSCDSNFDIKFRFKNQTIKIKYVLIFFVVTTLNCLWCSFSQQSNPTDECEKRQTKCEWYFAHMNEGSMSELSWSPVVRRL